MSQVDKLQDAEEQVAQMQADAARAEREARTTELRRAPLADTAAKMQTTIAAPLTAVRTMVNMRVGPLPDLHELALSIKETGVLHPPLVRATGEEDRPYELLAGRRRFAAMGLIDEADGPREDWRFTLVDGISKREALTMQFAENFHQHKPAPVQFARAARAIMAEDPELSAADVSRLVGAPATWARKALRLLDLPDSIVERVERGDLSFTVADLVRRGIARGDVAPEQAEDLVARHADGEISGGSLKLGVGYVPPKPKDYDEQSRKLDEARWAAARGPSTAEDDAEQRDWESSGSRGGAGPAEPAAARRERRRAVADEDLDAYVLGLVLARVMPAERRAAFGVRDEDGAHRYAFSVRPADRLGVLRAIASELLDADAQPPQALRRAA